MIVYYVAGGSYKAFYLNNFFNLGKCDLLIFNFNILNDIENSSLVKSSTVKEILQLSKKIKCKIIAGVNVKINKVWRKKILICENSKFRFYDLQKGAELKVKTKTFFINAAFKNFKANNKIIFSTNQLLPNVKACSKNKIYIFCDSMGVNYVINKNLKRNFNKCSKIILK